MAMIASPQTIIHDLSSYTTKEYYMARLKSCSSDGLERLYTLFRATDLHTLVSQNTIIPSLAVELNPKLIPLASTVISTASVEDILRAKWSLLCLAEALEKPGDPKLRQVTIRVLFTEKHRVFPWVSFLLRRYLCGYPEDEAVSFNEIMNIVQAMLTALVFAPPSIQVVSNPDTGVMTFAIEAWYRLPGTRISQDCTRPLAESIDMALCPLWTGFLGQPPTLVLDLLEREHVVAETALIHVTWNLKIVASLPTCVDPSDEFLTLAHSLERLADIFIYPQIMNLIGLFWISRLPADFKCNHTNVSSLDNHSPIGQRCLNEGCIIDDCWMVLIKAIRNATGIGG